MKLDKLNLEQLLDLRDEVERLIQDKEPSIEELLSLGVALEYAFKRRPKELEKQYKTKLDALKKIYSR